MRLVLQPMRRVHACPHAVEEALKQRPRVFTRLCAPPTLRAFDAHAPAAQLPDNKQIFDIALHAEEVIAYLGGTPQTLPLCVSRNLLHAHGTLHSLTLQHLRLKVIQLFVPGDGPLHVYFVHVSIPFVDFALCELCPVGYQATRRCTKPCTSPLPFAIIHAANISGVHSTLFISLLTALTSAPRSINISSSFIPT